jgi:hypothetical protein
MQNYPLTKIILALALTLSIFTANAQTNASYINIRSMPTSLPGNLDYMIYGKQSGTNYFWYRVYSSDFYNNYTNSPAGVAQWAYETNSRAIASGAAASSTTSSNSLQAQISANLTAQNSASNAVAALALAASTKDTVTSNTLYGNFSNYYPASNPSSYQTAAQVAATASAAAAQAVATGTTNGGNVNFGNVVYTPLSYTNSGSSVTVDLSRASLQFITITNNSYTTLFFTNQAPGQNVTVDLYNQGSGAFLVAYPPSARTQNGSSSFGNLHANSHAIISFLTLGTNVFCSSSFSFY